MAIDKNLNTGEYSPRDYWSERVCASKGNTYKAVCAYNLIDVENKAMEKIQLFVLNKILKDINFKNKNVLEFGCGVGRLVQFFLRQGSGSHWG